jgi:glutamate synthase domain-containing protein 1
MSWASQENHYRDDKVFDACGLFGFIDTSGAMHDGRTIVEALDSMKERGNGLGSGYAAYGVYPDFAEQYALHVMCRSEAGRQALEARLRQGWNIIHDEPIPHREVAGVLDAPILWRYFATPSGDPAPGLSEEDDVVRQVMAINSEMGDAFIYSSGKNMAIFKGVGHPEQIAEYYRVHEYYGYLWVGHNRFPTNTPGWWGGAHPFGLLDWSVVHNGEISSYGTNRRYMETHGYQCTMQTDTEVIAYAADLVMRRHGLPPHVAALVFASPLWDEIQHLPKAEQRLCRAVRQTYGPLLLNGPFTVIIARQGQMMGLGDRIRLRPLAVGIKDDLLYVSSELSAIHLVQPEVTHTWTPEGGQVIVGRLGQRPVPPEHVLRREPVTERELSYG